MRTRMLPALMAVLILIGTTLGTAPIATAASYVTLRSVQEIAPDGYAPSSVADAKGALHIVFVRHQKPGLWYATNATGAWVTKQISSTWGNPHTAIDAAGHLYIAYDSGTGIRLLTDRSGSWVGTRLTTEGTDRDPAIAVDGLGEVHIVYGEGELIYLTNRRGYWSRLTLNQGDAYHPSIALDQNRRVHIAFERSTPTLAYITDKDGVAWKTTTVTSSGRRPSIALRGTVPSVAYLRPADSAGGVYLATLGSTTWTSVRPYGGYVPLDGAPSLKLDTSGKAHISYQVTDSGGRGIIEYATNTTGAWVRTGLGLGATPTMILGPSGAKHFTFATTAVYLRSSTLPGWSASTVEASGYDTQPDVAAAPDGKPRLVYAYPWVTPGLRVGTWNGSAFTTTKITTSEDRQPAIAVDANGASHVAFVRTGSPMGLWYGTDATGSWGFEEIASDDEFTCPDLAIGEDGHIHVTARRTHTDTGFTFNRPVWYTNASGSWAVRDDLPVVTGAEACPRLAVDANDDPHITYLDVQIQYTHLVSGDWVTQAFGGGGYQGGDIAIAPDGSIVLTYGRDNQYDSATGGLYVRTNATGSWVSTLVGRTADTVARHGLAIDADAGIHLAYRGYIWDTGLHYATNEGGAWTTFRVTDRDTGGPAVSVDDAGSADIVVSGPAGGGLTDGVQHAHH